MIFICIDSHTWRWLWTFLVLTVLCKAGLMKMQWYILEWAYIYKNECEKHIFIINKTYCSMYGLVETLKWRKKCKGIFAFLRKFVEEFMYFIYIFFMLVSSLESTVHIPILGRKLFSGHYYLIFFLIEKCHHLYHQCRNIL